MIDFEGQELFFGTVVQSIQNIEENIINFHNKAAFLTLDFYESILHPIFISSGYIFIVRTMPPDVI